MIKNFLSGYFRDTSAKNDDYRVVVSRNEVERQSKRIYSGAINEDEATGRGFEASL